MDRLTPPLTGTLDFRAGEPILRPGTGRGLVYLIRSGQVRLRRVLADGRRLPLGLLGPDDLFTQGDASGPAGSISAVAVTDARVSVLPLTALPDLLAISPSLAAAAVGRLLERMQTAPGPIHAGRPALQPLVDPWHAVVTTAARDDRPRPAGRSAAPPAVHTVADLPEALLEGEGARLLWDKTSDAIAVSDADGVVLAANPAYAELYGYELDQVIGQSFEIIFPPDYRPMAKELYRQSFNGPPLTTPIESDVRRADGSPRRVEARTAFLERDGRRVAMVSFIRDITDTDQDPPITAPESPSEFGGAG